MKLQFAPYPSNKVVERFEVTESQSNTITIGEVKTFLEEKMIEVTDNYNSDIENVNNIFTLLTAFKDKILTFLNQKDEIILVNPLFRGNSKIKIRDFYSKSTNYKTTWEDAILKHKNIIYKQYDQLLKYINDLQNNENTLNTLNDNIKYTEIVKKNTLFSLNNLLLIYDQYKTNRFNSNASIPSSNTKYIIDKFFIPIERLYFQIYNVLLNKKYDYFFRLQTNYYANRNEELSNNDKNRMVYEYENMNEDLILPPEYRYLRIGQDKEKKLVDNYLFVLGYSDDDQQFSTDKGIEYSKILTEKIKNIKIQEARYNGIIPFSGWIPIYSYIENEIVYTHPNHANEEFTYGGMVIQNAIDTGYPPLEGWSIHYTEKKGAVYYTHPDANEEFTYGEMLNRNKSLNPNNKKKKTGLIVGVTIGSIILVGLFAFLVVKPKVLKKSTKKKKIQKNKPKK